MKYIKVKFNYTVYHWGRDREVTFEAYVPESSVDKGGLVDGLQAEPDINYTYEDVDVTDHTPLKEFDFLTCPEFDAIKQYAWDLVHSK